MWHRENSENGQKNSLSGKREFGFFFLNTGNFVNSNCKCSDSKSKGIVIVDAKKIISFSRSWIGLPSQFCVCNTHKLCKLAKFAVGQGKHREFENTI